jgi:hypothetical protein
MNILNRLQKLETRSGDSEFCACYPQRFEIYTQDLGKDALTNKPILEGEKIPDVCPECLKQTEKNSIIVQIVDGLNKDRFPDEWKANKNKMEI